MDAISLWLLLIPFAGIFLLTLFFTRSNSSRHCPSCRHLLPSVAAPRCPACGENI